MNSESWLRKPIVKFALGILVLLLIGVRIYLAHPQAVVAQSTGSLSSELLSLRTQVNLLESEVNRLSRLVERSERRVAPSRINTPQLSSTSDPRTVESTDPMFQRLATLVIELKARIVELEERMTSLEAQID